MKFIDFAERYAVPGFIVFLVLSMAGSLIVLEYGLNVTEWKLLLFNFILVSFIFGLLSRRRE